MFEHFLEEVYKFSDTQFIILLVAHAFPTLVFSLLLTWSMCRRDKTWATNILLATSQLVNALGGGKFDETLADRVHTIALNNSGKTWGGFWATVSNAVNKLSWFE